MQMLLTVKEPKVSIENGRGGTLIKLSANFQRIDRWVLHSSFSKSGPHHLHITEIFGKFNKISSKNYLFKVNNRNNRTRHEICSKLTIKTPNRNKLGIDFTFWFYVFIVDFEQLIWAVSGFSEVLLLPILNRYFVIPVIRFLNCWVWTGKCRKSFHSCRKLLSTGVNVQNVPYGECLSDWFSLPG